MKEERKDLRVGLRLSEVERARIDALAKDVGVSRAEYIRQMIRAEYKKVMRRAR